MSSNFRLLMWPVALFCLLWVDLIRLLSAQWEAREQYSYGWFVPFFAVALLVRHWQDHPSGEGAVRSSGDIKWFGLLNPWVVVPLVSLLPFRVIYEINTDWPLAGWLYTLLVIWITLYAFYLARGWPMVRHVAFPVAFILLAVVWPHRVEKGLTQGLMRVVASLTVELLGWLDIPAVQKGNLIELETTTVGIDEACSGIRSFQSCLMAGLLMGEFYRFRIVHRAFLLVTALAVGFCLNVVRTLMLSWQASTNGLQALEKWHDPAGLTIAVACFFVVWGLAVLITRIQKPGRGTQSASALGQVPVGTVPPLAKESAVPATQPGPGVSSAPLLDADWGLRNLRKYLVAVGLYVVCVLGFNEVWYRLHEAKAKGAFFWTTQFPTNDASYAAIELDKRTRKLLRHDQADCGRWKEEGGKGWAGYYFRWDPKSITSIISARQHRPDICLPAAGLKLVDDAGIERFAVKGLELPFRKYTYSSPEGKEVHVFFCQWEDGSEQQGGMAYSALGERVAAALRGRRHLGQQSLEMILTDYASLEEARQALKRRLPDLIRVAQPGTTDG